MKILYVGEGTYAQTIQKMCPSFELLFPQRRAHLHAGLIKLGHDLDVLSVDGNTNVKELGGFNKYDIVYTDNPIIGSQLKRLDLFDYVDWYSDMYRIEHGDDPGYYFIKSAERTCSINAKMVVCQGRPIADIVRPYAEHYCIIPNGVDPEMFYPPPYEPCAETCGPCGVEGEPFKIVYTGKLTKWYRKILHACEAVKRLPDDYELYVVGDGELYPEVEQYGEECDRIHVTGPVRYDQVPEYTRMADLCIFPVDDDSPIAIYEYMACGKPILVLGDRMQWFLEPGVNANYIKGTTPLSWMSGITELKENVALRSAMAQTNQIESKKYHWSVLSKMLEEAMVKCCL